MLTYLGSGVQHRAVLHHQRVGVEGVPAQGGKDEGGAVCVLPVQHTSDPLPLHVRGVVLGPYEAVLHQPVIEGVDAVSVGSPGEDLHPPGDGRLVLVVAGSHTNRVVGGVCDGDSL